MEFRKPQATYNAPILPPNPYSNLYAGSLVSFKRTDERESISLVIWEVFLLRTLTWNEHTTGVYFIVIFPLILSCTVAFTHSCIPYPLYIPLFPLHRSCRFCPKNSVFTPFPFLRFSSLSFCILILFNTILHDR